MLDVNANLLAVCKYTLAVQILGDSESLLLDISYKASVASSWQPDSAFLNSEIDNFVPADVLVDVLVHS